MAAAFIYLLLQLRSPRAQIYLLDSQWPVEGFDVCVLSNCKVWGGQQAHSRRFYKAWHQNCCFFTLLGTFPPFFSHWVPWHKFPEVLMVVSSDCRPVAGSPSAQPALGSVKFPSSPQLPWQQPVSLCPDLAAVPHGNTIHKGNMRRCFLGQGFSPGRFQKGPCPPLCSSVTPTCLCSLDCPGITWQSLPRVRFILAVILRSIRANQLQIGASCHVGWHAWLMPHPWPHAGLTSPQPALLSQQLSSDCWQWCWWQCRKHTEILNLNTGCIIFCLLKAHTLYWWPPYAFSSTYKRQVFCPHALQRAVLQAALTASSFPHFPLIWVVPSMARHRSSPHVCLLSPLLLGRARHEARRGGKQPRPDPPRNGCRLSGRRCMASVSTRWGGAVPWLAQAVMVALALAGPGRGAALFSSPKILCWAQVHGGLAPGDFTCDISCPSRRAVGELRTYFQP